MNKYVTIKSELVGSIRSLPYGDASTTAYNKTGLFKSLFWGFIVVFNTHINSIIFKIKDFAPFSKRLIFPAVFYYKITASIPSLLFSISPSNIAKKITLSVVYSVYAKPLLIAIAKLFKENTKIIPAGIKFYTITAISFIGFIIRVIATLFNRIPNNINRMIPETVFDGSVAPIFPYVFHTTKYSIYGSNIKNNITGRKL